MIGLLGTVEALTQPAPRGGAVSDGAAPTQQERCGVMTPVNKNTSQQTASKLWDDTERFMLCPKCGEMIDLHNMHQVRVHALCDLSILAPAAPCG